MDNNIKDEQIEEDLYSLLLKISTQLEIFISLDPEIHNTNLIHSVKHIAKYIQNDVEKCLSIVDK